MIYGMTHDDNGKLKKTTSFYGKISTGLPPMSMGNQNNYPVALGHYVVMIKKSKTIAGELVERWFKNQEVHKIIGDEPKELEFFAMGKCVDDIWRSSLQSYTASGLFCQGNGKAASRLFIENDKRVWKGIECSGRKCEVFAGGNCSAMGRLIVNLVHDPHVTTPYRYDTKSINSINSIESGLYDAERASWVAWNLSGGKINGPFMGFLGMKFKISLKRKKSGGRQIWYSIVGLSEAEDDRVLQLMVRGAQNQQLLMMEKSKNRENPLLITAEDVEVEDGTNQAEELEDLAHTDVPGVPDVQGHEDTPADQEDISKQFALVKDKKDPSNEWGESDKSESEKTADGSGVMSQMMLGRNKSEEQVGRADVEVASKENGKLKFSQ